MKQILNLISKNLPIIILLVLFSYLFFIRLSWTSLTDWDEAWYAVISRQMLKDKDFLNSKWDNLPFVDHPPLGFWLMAISYSLFGINELSVRLPSAILGLLSILLLYKICQNLSFSKLVSFFSPLILGTSVWYVLRVRSGNLDSILVFFYLLTIFFNLKSKQNFKYFILTLLSFGFLVLSKTLVGFSAIPLIIYHNFANLKQFKKNSKIIFISISIFLIVVLPWYLTQILQYNNFLIKHFIGIGLRRKGIMSFFNFGKNYSLFYLHMGIRKWFYPWVLSFFYLILSFKWLKNKNYLFLILWNFIILYPFLTSEETGIWHMIPAFPVISIIIAIGFSELINDFQYIFTWLLLKIKVEQKMINKLKILKHLFLTIILGYLSILQIRIFYKEIIPDSKKISAESIISQKIGQFDQSLFLDGEFLPVAKYYSEKEIIALHKSKYSDSQMPLITLFQNEPKPFYLITKKNQLSNLIDHKILFEEIDNYQNYVILKGI